MCTMQKTLAGVTVTCANSGANNHAGLHHVVATFFGWNYTWRWAAPASSQNALNTDDVLAAHKPIVVGQADK